MADAVEVDDVDLALDEGSSESPRVAGDVTEDTVDTPAPAAGSDTADTQAAAGAESTAAPSDDTAPQGDAKADGGDGGAASGADDGSGHDDGGIVSVSGEVSAEVAALVEGALGRLSPAGAAPQGPAAPPEATRAARRGSGGIGGAAERPVSSERTGSVSSRDDSGLAIRRTLSNASRGSRGSKRSASFSVGSAASRPTSLLGALRRSPGELLVALRAALRDGGELPSVVQALSTLSEDAQSEAARLWLQDTTGLAADVDQALLEAPNGPNASALCSLFHQWYKSRDAVVRRCVIRHCVAMVCASVVASQRNSTADIIEALLLAICHEEAAPRHAAATDPRPILTSRSVFHVPTEALLLRGDVARVPLTDWVPRRVDAVTDATRDDVFAAVLRRYAEELPGLPLTSRIQFCELCILLHSTAGRRWWIPKPISASLHASRVLQPPALAGDLQRSPAGGRSPTSAGSVGASTDASAPRARLDESPGLSLFAVPSDARLLQPLAQPSKTRLLRVLIRGLARCRGPDPPRARRASVAPEEEADNVVDVDGALHVAPASAASAAMPPVAEGADDSDDDSEESPARGASDGGAEAPQAASVEEGRTSGADAEEEGEFEGDGAAARRTSRSSSVPERPAQHVNAPKWRAIEHWACHATSAAVATRVLEDAAQLGLTLLHEVALDVMDAEILLETSVLLER